jgi:hypothetical protein
MRVRFLQRAPLVELRGRSRGPERGPEGKFRFVRDESFPLST